MGLKQSELELVFAGVPRVGPVEGCTYCYTQAELDQLGADRAGVPDDLVMAFARESDGHWNEEQYGLLWRGLAPRILGLLERWRDEMLLKGLTFARFGTWPEPERSAVRGALRAMVARAVTEEEDPLVASTFLGAAANADQDLKPWLDYVDTLTGPDADAGIARLAQYWADDPPGHQPMLWWFPEDPFAAVRDWLYSDLLHERLKRMGDLATQIAIAQM